MSEPGPWGRRDGTKPPSAPAAGRKPRPPRLYLWLGLLAAVGAAFLLLAWLFPADRGDRDWTDALRLFGVLALVTSGVARARARTLDLPAMARRAALWLGIWVVGVTVFVFRDDAARMGGRILTALAPARASQIGPRALVIGRGDDRAFSVIGQLNGVDVRFVIDTGATDIVLSPADAARAGIAPAPGAKATPTETANGLGYGTAAVAASLAVGPIRLADAPVMINQAPMNGSLLGMAFLQHLESFEVRGDRMTLRGRN
jgi:aspartyl protease family protein